MVMTHRSRSLLAILAATTLTACQPQDVSDAWHSLIKAITFQDRPAIKESLEDQDTQAEPFQGASTLSGAYLVGRHA